MGLPRPQLTQSRSLERVRIGFYWGYIGMMEKTLETNILYWDYIGVIIGLHWGYIGIVEKTRETALASHALVLTHIDLVDENHRLRPVLAVVVVRLATWTRLGELPLKP